MSVNFLNIDKILINPEIIGTSFTCDLEECRGACCTMESDFGAPLEKEEIDTIESVLQIVIEYLPKRNVNEIRNNGFWEQKSGQLMTSSIHKRDCVFVYYEGDIARCAIEKAYFDGKIKFQKPISCHLFPIRISDFGGNVLRYEVYSNCKPALEFGKETEIKIHEFCKDALIRKFGKSWYEKLKCEVESK